MVAFTPGLEGDKTFRKAMEGNGEDKTVPEFMTVLEVAELLKVSDRTVYDLCRQGLLPGAAKIGKQWRVDKDDLLAWVKAGGMANMGKEPSKDE